MEENSGSDALELSEEDLKLIGQALSEFKVHGTRNTADQQVMMNL